MYFSIALIRYLMVSYTIHTKSFEGTAFHVFITAIIYLKHDTECNNLDKKHLSIARLTVNIEEGNNHQQRKALFSVIMQLILYYIDDICLLPTLSFRTIIDRYLTFYFSLGAQKYIYIKMRLLITLLLLHLQYL